MSGSPHQLITDSVEAWGKTQLWNSVRFYISVTVSFNEQAGVIVFKMSSVSNVTGFLINYIHQDFTSTPVILGFILVYVVDVSLLPVCCTVRTVGTEMVLGFEDSIIYKKHYNNNNTGKVFVLLQHWG